MKIKVIKVAEKLQPYKGEKDGKPYVIHQAMVEAVVDGVVKEIKVSSWMVPFELVDGSEIEVTPREYKGRFEYRLAKPGGGQRQGGGGAGGGRKPPYTLAEIDALMAHACEEVKKYVPDISSPQGAELYQKLLSTYIIAATDTGAKVEGPAPRPAPASKPTAAAPSGNGTAKARVRTLFDSLDFGKQDAKKNHILKELEKDVSPEKAEQLIKLMNTWHLPAKEEVLV